MGEGAGKNHFLEKKFYCVIIWDRGCGIMGEMRQFWSQKEEWVWRELGIFVDR